MCQLHLPVNLISDYTLKISPHHTFKSHSNMLSIMVLLSRYPKPYSSTEGLVTSHKDFPALSCDYSSQGSSQNHNAHTGLHL